MICHHPLNPHIQNAFAAKMYLFALRYKLKPLKRLLGMVLGNDIRCPIPTRLFLPHPYGIIVGGDSVLEDDVVLMQQVTLGGKDPHWGDAPTKGIYPVVRKGAYIGAGAKLLGPVEIGEFAIVGANAVITKDVPACATAVGVNKILPKRP
jgi:serine O-acetyltransferase